MVAKQATRMTHCGEWNTLYQKLDKLIEFLKCMAVSAVTISKNTAELVWSCMLYITVKVHLFHAYLCRFISEWQMRDIKQ